MNDPSTPARQPPAGREGPSPRLAALVLVAAAAVLFLARLGARDLWNPNEPLYGRAVAEMAERGDWLVSTVNGREFAEKPALYYWLALGAARVFGGVNEFTLRLPAAVAGVLGVLGLFAMVRGYAGTRRAVLAAAALATTYMYFWSARTLQMDILVAVTTLFAVGSVARVFDLGARPLAGWAAAGLATGLGFLAKGPVGLICPGLVVLVTLAVTRRLKELRPAHLLLAAAVFLGLAAPYAGALWLAGKRDFLAEMFFRQNVTRFLGAWDHRQPWWYYLEYLFIDMAPWALLLPAAAGLRQNGERGRRLATLSWVWIASVVVFFSLSDSKRSPYILPVAPAVAILASDVLERIWAGAGISRLRAVWSGSLAAVVSGALLAGGLFVLLRGSALPIPPSLVPMSRSAAAVLAVAGAAVLASLALRPRRAVAAVFAALFGLYAFTGLAALPAVNAVKSSRSFCDQVAAIQRSTGAELFSFGLWEWRASYIYYLGRNVPNLTEPAALVALWRSDRKVLLIVEGDREEEARKLLGGAAPLVSSRVGSGTVFLFGNVSR
jgi:4-amino-4-deoxy-L-arabinose transferase-like glycosyltransferase